MPYTEVMHKWKTGNLHSGSKSGPTVKSRAQAVAIMLSEKKKAGEGKAEYQPRRAAVKMKTQKVDLGNKGSFEVKKGALHRDLGIPLGEKIPESTLKEKAGGSGQTARRARAALGFRAMRHG